MGDDSRTNIQGISTTVGGKPVIQLEPDVAEVFPDAASVNEALRFLIRVTKENNASLQ